MPKKVTNVKRRIIDKILTSLGAIAVLVLLGVGGLAWWAYSFTNNNVRTELAAQKIYFPAKNSTALNALPAQNRQAMDKYAGKQLLSGSGAKTYADDFIAFHLSEIGGGQTYSQISAASQANPNDAKVNLYGLPPVASPSSSCACPLSSRPCCSM